MVNEFARSLRKSQTTAERTLWCAIRRSQLTECRFRRQHPIGPYVVDFICLEKKLVIELDGDQHGHDLQKVHDEKRDCWLASHGYHVVRFWNGEVYKNLDGVLREILEHLNIPNDALPPP